MKSKIVKGAIASYVSIGFNILSVILYTPFLIRSLGRSEYAIYTTIYAFVSYFVIDFGLGGSIAKFLTDAKYKHGTKYLEEDLLSIFFKSFIFLSTCIAVALFAIYFLLDYIFKGLTPNELNLFKEAYIVLAIYTVISFAFIPLEGIYTANELFAELKWFVLAKKGSTIFCTVIVLFLDYGLLGVIWVGAVSDCCVILCEVLYLYKKNLLRINWKYWNSSVLKEILGFSIWMAVIVSCQRLIIPITPTILGHFSNSNEVAIFSLGMILEQYVYTFAAALNGLFLPKISRIIYMGDDEGLNQLQLRIGRIQVYIVGTVLCGFCVFGKDFLNFWVGTDYADTYWIFLLISASDIVSITLSIAENVIIVQNLVKQRAVIYIMGTVFSFLMSCILARHYGAIGSSVAICIELWLFNIVGMIIVYNKYTTLNMTKFLKLCHLKILPIFLIYGIAWLFIEKYILNFNLMQLIIKIGVFVTILCVLLLKFSLNEDEKLMIKKLLKWG